MLFSSGQKLYGDRYEIIKQIGEGGFGITYLAKDSKGKQVVIKTLNENAQNSPGVEQLKVSFKDEALKLASCNHPHIVKYENFFNQDKLPCLVMEYIDGLNLWEIVNKQGVLDEFKALLFVQQIGSALMETHSQGLLHRDVKPNNIILRRSNWEVVLIDFGLSRQFHNQNQAKNELLNHGFAALEQYIQGLPQGEFTDVYALAATLYYLLTKIVPTPSFTRASKAKGVVLKPPREINPDINLVVNQAIMMGMTLDPNDDNRPKNIEKWLDLFGELIPSIDSNAPTWKISGVQFLNELKSENRVETESKVARLGKLELFKKIANIFQGIFETKYSNNLVNSKGAEVNLLSQSKYKSPQILQPKRDYNLREKNIADLLIARNLPGLFEKLLELKGLQINQDYTLRWLYAVGGQSIVYLAEKSNQDLVIVKIPYLDYHRPAYISQSQINKNRFHLVKEGELLKKFNHTNLPNFFELIYSFNPLHNGYRSDEIVNQEPYLVMEFIKGVDLLELTRDFHNQPSIDYEELELLAWEIISKMNYFCITIFQEGYLYSDINPLNLILTANDAQIRILDAASLIPINQDGNISPPFTESYISVEYWEAYEQGKIIYPNSQDVMYAMGKMLWEMLTNKQPYPGENPNLSEPVFQKYSADLQNLINHLIHSKYNNFEDLQKALIR
ncbi:MAG: protein kinase [Okeania sp. SIO3I5]|uniref:protein kinase domain-containing protein n=1 Tax=Okeania sp. SIO3I5 TaxID=2607805 RepID=UPI0013B7736A|nr:protein kinase [Okeania sp. SIO3I5]NEQ37759.1 protein kinase [Okeania sp. SIO3I5]